MIWPIIYLTTIVNYPSKTIDQFYEPRFLFIVDYLYMLE
jgi:hypothetical protein